MKFSPMLLVAALVAVIVVLVVTRPEGADVVQARRQTQAAIALASQVLMDNKTLKARADSAHAEAAALEKKAVVAEASYANSKHQLFKAALAAPDTCGPVILAAQLALVNADGVIANRTGELAAALAADSVDSKRADNAEVALDSLRKPAQALVSATNQGFLARLKRLRPEMSAGVLGGVDLQGKPNAVVGVGLTVHF